MVNIKELSDELTSAHFTIEKCREISGCPEGKDLQEHLNDLVKDVSSYRDAIYQVVNWTELEVYSSAWEFCNYDGEEAMAKLEETLNGGKCL